MKKIIVLIGVVVMIALVTTSLRDIFISSKPEEDSQLELTAAPATNSQVVADSNSQQVEGTSPSAQYLEYSRQNFIANESARKVLFFYANWCPTCQPVDKEFSQNMTKLPSDVVVIRVNYNDDQTDEAEKSLAKKYGVTYQHTFVQIDKDGNEIAKWNGEGLDKLLSNLK